MISRQKLLISGTVSRNDTHMTSMTIAQFSRPVQSRPKFFHPLDLRRPISNELPLPSPNDNQSIKRKHNPIRIITHKGLLYVIRSFPQVGFHFQYQPINLVWLSIDFFSFS